MCGAEMLVIDGPPLVEGDRCVVTLRSCSDVGGVVVWLSWRSGHGKESLRGDDGGCQQASDGLWLHDGERVPAEAPLDQDVLNAPFCGIGCGEFCDLLG